MLGSALKGFSKVVESNQSNFTALKGSGALPVRVAIRNGRPAPLRRRARHPPVFPVPPVMRMVMLSRKRGCSFFETKMVDSLLFEYAYIRDSPRYCRGTVILLVAFVLFPLIAMSQSLIGYLIDTRNLRICSKLAIYCVSSYILQVSESSAIRARRTYCVLSPICWTLEGKFMNGIQILH